MTVSLCIIARNEQAALEKLLEDVKAQTYPHAQIEVVLVDNLSADGTKAVMEAFAAQKNGFQNVTVAQCPKVGQAAAWNCAVLHAGGEIIIRVDAHASIPQDFVSCNVEHIQQGEFICGGGRPCRAEKATPWQGTLLAAEESLFGSSVAKYRRQQAHKQYVSSVFHAAYRREVFAKVGGFNENLGRTEDNEIHYRMRRSGFKIACYPDIVSYQNVRATFRKMLRQKYANGLWIGLTLGVCPQCLSCFHFAPFLLVCALLVFGVLSCFGIVLPLIAVSGAYLLFDLLVTVTAFWGRKAYWQFFLLPFMFPLLHIVYGTGTLFGICKMPFWKAKLGTDAQQSIELVKNTVQKKIEQASRKTDG